MDPVHLLKTSSLERVGHEARSELCYCYGVKSTVLRVKPGLCKAERSGVEAKVRCGTCRYTFPNLEQLVGKLFSQLSSRQEILGLSDLPKVSNASEHTIALLGRVQGC
jgi:hypothetical protein